MMPKTTLNLLKDFFSNSIQMTVLLLLSLFEKKIWPDTFKISHIIPEVSNSSITFVKSVFTITTSKTDESENIKSAPPEEMYYYALYIANL